MLLFKHPLVLSLLLITAASPVASAAKAFENKDELQAAADSYCANPAAYNTSTYGSIENWDVSKITSMKKLFHKKSCNPDIGSWDVSKVTDFGKMFLDAEAFNKDISNWDVSNGTNFGGVFMNAGAFNQDVSNWDVSNGTDFGYMFMRTVAFNQDITNWDVSNGTKFINMFLFAEAFDQPLLYCNWQSNSIFKNTNNGYYSDLCFGSVSCGWGQSECHSPTPPITPTPPTPPSNCSDDCDFKFDLNFVAAEKGCFWITKNKKKASKRKESYCAKSEISNACQATCSSTCENDSSIMFELTWAKKEVNCAWITKNRKKSASRKEKYCGTYGTDCVSACGRCSA